MAARQVLDGDHGIRRDVPLQARQAEVAAAQVLHLLCVRKRTVEVPCVSCKPPGARPTGGTPHGGGLPVCCGAPFRTAVTAGWAASLNSLCLQLGSSLASPGGGRPAASTHVTGCAAGSLAAASHSDDVIQNRPLSYARAMDPSRQLGIDAVRAWRARCLMPLFLVLLHVTGVSLDDTALARLASFAAAVLVLTHAWTYIRVQTANDTANSVVVPQAGGEAECLTFAVYDARAAKQLASSTLVALATAWFMHKAKVVSSLLVLQCVLLPLSVWDAEVVRLHLWREDPSRPCLQRPWPSETDKAFAACVWLFVCGAVWWVD